VAHITSASENADL